MEHVWLVSALPSQDENAALLRGLAARHVPDCPDGQGRLGVRAGLELALQTCLSWHSWRGFSCTKKLSLLHGNPQSLRTIWQHVCTGSINAKERAL